MVYDARFTTGPEGTIRHAQMEPPTPNQLEARAYDTAVRLDVPLRSFEEIDRAGAILEILGKALRAIGRQRGLTDLEAIGMARTEVREAKGSLVNKSFRARR